MEEKFKVERGTNMKKLIIYAVIAIVLLGLTKTGLEYVKDNSDRIGKAVVDKAFDGLDRLIDSYSK